MSHPTYGKVTRRIRSNATDNGPFMGIIESLSFLAANTKLPVVRLYNRSPLGETSLFRYKNDEIITIKCSPSGYRMDVPTMYGVVYVSYTIYDENSFVFESGSSTWSIPPSIFFTEKTFGIRFRTYPLGAANWGGGMVTGILYNLANEEPVFETTGFETVSQCDFGGSDSGYFYLQLSVSDLSPIPLTTVLIFLGSATNDDIENVLASFSLPPGSSGLVLNDEGNYTYVHRSGSVVNWETPVWISAIYFAASSGWNVGSGAMFLTADIDNMYALQNGSRSQILLKPYDF